MLSTGYFRNGRISERESWKSDSDVEYDLLYASASKWEFVEVRVIRKNPKTRS